MDLAEGRYSSRSSLEDDNVDVPLIRSTSRPSPYLTAVGRHSLFSRIRSCNVSILHPLIAVPLAVGLVVLGSVTVLIATSATSVTPIATDARGYCRRILVHKFENGSGFGSEFSIYLRLAALQDTIGFAVVPDSRDWIYGDFPHYWMPVTYPCSLPDDTFDTRYSVKFGDLGWERARRVVLTRDRLGHLDQFVRKKTIDAPSMRALAQREKNYQIQTDRITLPYGESIPQGLETSFLQQASTMAHLARPNARMQAQIGRLAMKLGLNESDTTKRSPVVVVQIRLGDKWVEQNDIKDAGSHIAFGDLAPYFQAAQLALQRLYDQEITPERGTFPRAARMKPILVVMTAETGIVERMQELDGRNEFTIIQSPSAEFTPEEAEEYARLFTPRLQRNAAMGREASPDHLLARRWSQEMLYSASLSLRLALTRQLIAELTVYSTQADAFVVSGNSNLGRLALLMAGEEGALGVGSQRVHGGRVRSIDVPFYPTAYRSAIFT